MAIRQFEGTSIESLLSRVRTEIGTDARIVKAQKVRKGGFLGFFARELFQLTVELPGAAGRSPSGASGAPSAGRATRKPTSATRNGRSTRSPGLGPAPGGATGKTSTRGTGAGIEKKPRPGSDIEPLAPPARAASSSNDLLRRRYGLEGSDSGDLPATLAAQDTDGLTPMRDGVGEIDDPIPDFFGLVSDAGEATDVDDATEPTASSYADEISSLLASTDADEHETEAASSAAAPSAQRHWSYFIAPPRASDPGPAIAAATRDGETPEAATEEPLSSALSHPVPSTETASFSAVIGALSENAIDASSAGEVPLADGPSTVLFPESAARPGEGTNASVPPEDNHMALVVAPLSSGSDYLEDLSLMDSDEIAIVGEAPLLPPEVISILSRIPFAGALPAGNGHSTPDSSQGPGLLAWGTGQGTPGSVFAPVPYLPASLSEIGFPAALIPESESSLLAERLLDPDTEVDMEELAQGIFLEAVRRLPSPPEIPSAPGRLVVIAGAIAPARTLAAKLAGERGLDPAEVVIAAPEGSLGDVPAWMLIPDAEVAAKRRSRWSDKGQMTLVVVAAPLASADRSWARLVLEALQPDLVCGVVESTHKAEDVASWAVDLGRVDTLAIEGGAATRTPAAVLACGIPVSLIDGEEADADLWARIVGDRLARTGVDRVPASHMAPGAVGAPA